MALFEPVFAALDAAGPCRRAVDALVGLGLEPRAPVPAGQLADPARRRECRARLDEG